MVRAHSLSLSIIRTRHQHARSGGVYSKAILTSNRLNLIGAKGSIWGLRWLHLILIAVLAYGQFHLCSAVYEAADGRGCPTCATLTDAPRVVSTCNSALVASHGDCHDCCKTKVCVCYDFRVGTATTPNHGFTVDLLFAEPVYIVFNASPESFQPQVALECAPATGPPAETPSRAPPFITNLLPSAGRSLVMPS